MKYLLILLTLPFVLKTEPLHAKKNDSFVYVGIGPYKGLGIHNDRFHFWSPGVECNLGYRKHWDGPHYWDLNGGVTVTIDIPYPWPYFQTSYLFYPQITHGPYLGIGLTAIPLGIFPVFPNIPLTLGYQLKEKKQFVQFQFGAVNQSGSLLYGIGF